MRGYQAVAWLLLTLATLGAAAGQAPSSAQETSDASPGEELLTLERELGDRLAALERLPTDRDAIAARLEEAKSVLAEAEEAGDGASVGSARAGLSLVEEELAEAEAAVATDREL